jgi:hypothetical protein
MDNKQRVWFVLALFTFVGVLAFLYKLYKDFSEMDNIMQSIEHSKALYFEEVDQTIYIKTKVWGLLGDHSYISISDKADSSMSEDEDIIFDNTVLYYKVKYPDSLLVFLTSMSYSEEKTISKTIGNIKIKITEFNVSENRNYKENYEKIGLKKIDVNNIIE